MSECADPQNLGDRELLVKVFGLATRIDERCAGCHATLENHEKRINDHEIILDGPASNGNTPGLRTRVSELEGWRRTVVKVMMAAPAAIATVVSGVLIPFATGVIMPLVKWIAGKL